MVGSLDVSVRGQPHSSDRLVGVGPTPAVLELEPLVDEHGGVAAVVEDEVGAAAVGPGEQLLGAPPVLLECLALPGEDRDAWASRAVGPTRRRGGVILGGEDVAARPADVGAEVVSVSMSTAVWIVMCSEPAMRAPASGFARRTPCAAP